MGAGASAEKAAAAQQLPCVKILNDLANTDIAFEKEWSWAVLDMVKEHGVLALLGDPNSPMDEIMQTIMENSSQLSNACFLVRSEFNDQGKLLAPSQFAIIDVTDQYVHSPTLPPQFLDASQCKVVALGIRFIGFKDMPRIVGHATSVLINNLDKTVAWYDSNGYVPDTRTTIYDTDTLEALVRQWKSQQGGLEDYRLMVLSDYCPRIANTGVQDGTGGTCAAWTALIMYLQFACPTTSFASIIATLRTQPVGIRLRIIANWVKYCVQIYRFQIEKTRKPVKWYRQHPTLLFNPLIGKRLRKPLKPKKSGGAIDKARAKTPSSRVAYVPERIATRNLTKQKRALAAARRTRN
jgi:hypothetical protein